MNDCHLNHACISVEQAFTVCCAVFSRVTHSLTFSALLLHFHTAPVAAQSRSLFTVSLRRLASEGRPSCSLTRLRVLSSSAHCTERIRTLTYTHEDGPHTHSTNIQYLEDGGGTVFLKLLVLCLESPHQVLYHTL